MKNLIPYNKNCFKIHTEAVENKNKGESKERLKSIENNVDSSYTSFEEKFSSNKLNEISHDTFYDVFKDDLKSLYRFQSSVIKSLRNDLRKLQVRTIINTCQNCTIDSVNSLDHILPKEKFPEYIVNPKNLFPCCTTCNSYKNDSTGDEDENKFLNLYLDTLPKSQYLFVDVYLDSDNEIDFSYYLRNPEEQIESALFKLIENHFETLHLLERMRFKSIEYISEIENKILTFSKDLTLEQITENIRETVEKDKLAYGFNYWKCILELSLIESQPFLERIKKNASW